VAGKEAKIKTQTALGEAFVGSLSDRGSINKRVALGGNIQVKIRLTSVKPK
jgi:hypothetical protein